MIDTEAAVMYNQYVGFNDRQIRQQEFSSGNTENQRNGKEHQ
jgi:hypothetical protein